MKLDSSDHNKYLSYAFLGYGALSFLWLGFVFLMFLSSLFGSPGAPPTVVFVVGFAMILMLAFFTLPSLIAGWAGLNEKSWSRTIGIVASVMAVTSFPFGTIVGIYGLWFYFSDAWKEIYEDKEYVARGELPGKEVFDRWEMEAERYQREKEPVPPQGDWR